MAQHARPVGPTTNAASTFEPSMVQGTFPPAQASQRRAQLGPLPAGWHTAQTTPVAATFQSSMVSDTRPTRQRYVMPPRSDYDFIAPDVPAFSVEMTQGSRPDSPRLFIGPRIPLPLAQTTHVQTAFGPEMPQGQKPDRNREFLPLRTGLHVSQSQTPVAAPFGAEMSQGAIAGRPQLPFTTSTARRGDYMLGLDVIVPMVEMAQGSRPDTGRPFLAPRLPLPWSQTTQVGAPFSVEMSQGAVTGRPQLPFTAVTMRRGEFVLGLDVLVAMVEMAQGSRPDQPRQFLAPRIPLPVSQPTHVQAAITPDMLQGATVTRNRERLQLRIGTQTYPLDVTVLSPEMTQGVRPPQIIRQFITPRLPQPQSQPTHTAAPFTPSMVAGSYPDRYRQVLAKFGYLVYQVVQSIGPTATPDAVIQMLADAGIIDVQPDGGIVLTVYDQGDVDL